MTVQEILEIYRSQSFSEHHKGERFERLMQAFLRTSPLYCNLFKQIWMWEDFPARQDFGGKDIGIDLVAETHEGEFWAVQCKCYNADARITKPVVDSFLATSCKMFQMPGTTNKTGFTHRLWISTTDHWNSEAESIIRDTQPPVTRILLNDLENAGVDWGKIYHGQCGSSALVSAKTVRDHQRLAIERFHEHFLQQDRGRLIMACGTGKTFTALKIMEQQTDGKGLSLFLVPSIALLNQALIAWMTDASISILPICVCSDAKASRKRIQMNDSEDMAVVDLALPATTDVNGVVKQLRQAQEAGVLSVVFSTYQSIDVVSQAQAIMNASAPGSCIFDLIVCDEAHRTTGVTLKDSDESSFVKVHDNYFLPARKRLYMTATPRLYTEDSKSKAKEAEAILCSMDDPAIYGEEVFRIGFGEAVSKELLSDYKVLVLTVSDRDIPPSLQKSMANGEMEINTDDAAKLVGCISALSKRMLIDEELLKGPDPEPMHSAVAFCSNIKVSKQITTIFKEFGQKYYDALDEETRSEVVLIDTDHVDGTMAATERSAKLQWLASANRNVQHCHILHNVRCLSEGVDVPSLDAVLFLSPRNSQVDVVQSVGRVMRRSPGKKYGYIIIPVVIPSDVSPDEALNDNERFKVVWSVLNALRAHDDRFNAMVNKIELNKKKGSNQVIVAPPGTSGDGKDGDKPEGPGQLELPFVQGLQNAIYARMVEKVGSRRYWEQWASDVADIAKRHIERITKLIDQSAEHKKAFADFLAGLQKNINPSVTQAEAIEMLSQHMITKPVFEALFEDYSFVRSNPISIAMQEMLDVLEDSTLEQDQEVLQKFYASVQERASGIDNAEGRQKVIVELYDKFFKTAFPKTVDKLGIVYTPVEVVDFIVRSVAEVLKKEFDRDLSDENIHILDPFTGTGTFITRLLQCDLISSEALERKYSHEIHANEIVLLAYYIASINIENTFHDLRGDGQGDYLPFNGICLTDTFQLGENDDSKVLFSEMFSKNSERVIAQKKAPLRVIMGNPPYSVGQNSANDNAKNMSYLKLEKRIGSTYAKWSTATNKNSLYDSYIKAFRWASDRLDPENGGIIAFISNSGWMDGSAMDGFRKSLEEEFSSIYVFDLRGNCRTSGELRQREAGNVFGLGSRTPIAITILVKKPEHAGKVAIRYCDIGDYLSRDEKLTKIKQLGSIGAQEMNWQNITPNDKHDWINQRDGLFETFIPIGDKNNKQAKTFFSFYSCGVKTNRDSWVYNFSSEKLKSKIASMIQFYNENVQEFQSSKSKNKQTNPNEIIRFDPTKIAWSRGLRNDFDRFKYHKYDVSLIRCAVYRPFVKSWYYFDRNFNDMIYQIPKLFPTPESQNLVICVSGIGGTKQQSTIIVDCIPDVQLQFNGQCFPLYYYERNVEKQPDLFKPQTSGEYTRHEAITDFIFNLCREKYGHKITREDIFYYVYGLLHTPHYKERFADDLKKSLPHIPLVDSTADFQGFSQAGRQLAELHLHYESVEPYQGLEITGLEHNDFRVEKMRFADKDAKDVIVFNHHIQIAGIPLEAYEYVVNGKSAIEWIMDRYQITQHKDSQIVNDPNEWLDGTQPRYIFDLLLKIIRVSLETMAIVKQLPPLTF